MLPHVWISPMSWVQNIYKYTSHIAQVLGKNCVSYTNIFCTMRQSKPRQVTQKTESLATALIIFLNVKVLTLYKKLNIFPTSRILNRLLSQKFLQPTSVPMYQPLKAVPVNSRPPQSILILETAGKAYQRKPRSWNHS